MHDCINLTSVESYLCILESVSSYNHYSSIIIHQSLFIGHCSQSLFISHQIDFLSITAGVGVGVGLDQLAESSLQKRHKQIAQIASRMISQLSWHVFEGKTILKRTVNSVYKTNFDSIHQSHVTCSSSNDTRNRVNIKNHWYYPMILLSTTLSTLFIQSIEL